MLKNRIKLLRSKVIEIVGQDGENTIFIDVDNKGLMTACSGHNKGCPVLPLGKYKKEQEWFINLMGDKYDSKQNLVMANLFGKPIDTSNFTTRYFKKMLTCAELDRSFKFHNLRHTHATLLLLQGINIKVIQERLGHSNITMTLDTYSHLMPGMQETAVKALEGIFNIG